MEPRQVLLHEQLAARAPAIVSLTGGGGKTSLLFELGAALSRAGGSVLRTTTTRMLRPSGGECRTIVIEDDPRRLDPSGGGDLFAARPPAAGQDPDKVFGYRPEDIDELFRRGFAEWIVVEADGAARKPIKAPARHEPVIPSLTGLAVAVVGLGCMGRPLSGETAFRLEEMTAVTGLRPGDAITPDAVARLALHPQGMFKNIPEGAGRHLFCNQADLPGAGSAGRELAAILAATAPGFLDSFFVGSLRRDGLRCLSFPVADGEKPGGEMAVLVLAAGGGSRLGGGKLLLPWRGRPIILHTLGAVAGMRATAPLFVVIGHEAANVEQAVRDGFSPSRRAHFLKNRSWRDGQSTSLRLGIEAIAAAPECAGVKGVMVVLGDQPQIKPETLDLLAQSHREACGEKPAHRATAPVYKGKRGNPVILSPALFPAILELRGDVGARNILAGLGDALLAVPVDDPGVVRDIDTREQYSALQ